MCCGLKEVERCCLCSERIIMKTGHNASCYLGKEILSSIDHSVQ